MEELHSNQPHTRANYSKTSYSRNELTEFVDYVIKKTEDNVDTIKQQNNEIKRLRKELETYRKLEGSYEKVNNQAISNINELKEMAKKEAGAILDEAKDNANKIINSALIEAEKLETKKQTLESNIKLYKKKMRTVLLSQLAEIEDIEIL